MSVWGALAGGLVGTVVLSVGLELSQFAGWTRLDVPLMVGSAFAEDRDSARALGYASELVLGLAFALVYYAIFAATGLASWWFGLILGGVHAAFFGGPMANVLLPDLHPRMGKLWTDASQTPLLEPPGFLLANYGTGTLIVTTLVHLAFGAIVGAFAAGV
jgi:hypothetical protein